MQDAFDGRVLMQGYMNKDALKVTLESGQVTFWSRSREMLWTKGETSGNLQEIVNISFDCDADSLLFSVQSHGPACHTGERTCFYRQIDLS